MKKIMVTGATGFLGQAVVNELLHGSDYEVIAIGGRPEDRINLLPLHFRLKQYLLDDLFIHPFADIDTVVNCAFARSNDAVLLAQAFDFTERLIKRLVHLRVKSVINISSQGVYKRLPVGELSTEDSPIEPTDLYSMAKYATEKMFSVSPIPIVTNVRLASLMMPQRFLYYFMQNALQDKPFKVTAPRQYAALLDVKDAASGLASIIALDDDKASLYNLGIGKQYSILEYAESVKRIGVKFGHIVSYEVVEEKPPVCAGMDCSKLMKATGWKPLFLKDEMITNLFKEM